MKIACVVGARPNLMKIAPLVRTMRDAKVDYRLIHTGQHYDYDLDGAFFKELGIPTPDLNLGIGSSSHGRQTGEALIGLEKEFYKNQPDLVLVVGDVNSTLAAALAAAKLDIPVAHVEAGYRSLDRRMPEEINRVLVDHVSEFLFAPTQDAVDNLGREGIDKDKIHFVGNIMAETLFQNLGKIEIRKKHKEFGVECKRYIVATIHRPENVDDIERLREILSAFSEAPLPVIFPVHPRTGKQIESARLLAGVNGHLRLTGPCSYLEMMSLLSDAALVLTDSGGVQEEACLLKVPCLTLRNNTERTITITIGANRLIEVTKPSISRAIGESMASGCVKWPTPEKWDAQVAWRILTVLLGEVKPQHHALTGTDARQ